jgi:hypothetical protein
MPNLSEKEEDDLLRLEEANKNAETPSEDEFLMNV